MNETMTIKTAYIPPSVNACYRNVTGKGRVKTEAYRKWLAAVGYDLNAASRGGKKVGGAFSVTITIDRRKRDALSDIDNRCKPVLDALQAHGIIDNDRYCERATIEWGEAAGGMVVVIEPYIERAAA